METSTPVPVPAAVSPTVVVPTTSQVESSSFLDMVKDIVNNKTYLAIIISVIVVGYVYYMYTQGKLFFGKKEEIVKEEEEPTEADLNNNMPTVLDINKEYVIMDPEYGNLKINMKDLIQLQRHYMEQEKQQMEYEQEMRRQMMMQQRQKLKHPKKRAVEISEEEDDENMRNETDENLSKNELENLKRELEVLEKQNNAIN
jgi:hypothetical protein